MKIGDNFTHRFSTLGRQQGIPGVPRFAGKPKEAEQKLDPVVDLEAEAWRLKVVLPERAGTIDRIRDFAQRQALARYSLFGLTQPRASTSAVEGSDSVIVLRHVPLDTRELQPGRRKSLLEVRRECNRTDPPPHLKVKLSKPPETKEAKAAKAEQQALQDERFRRVRGQVLAFAPEKRTSDLLPVPPDFAREVVVFPKHRITNPHHTGSYDPYVAFNPHTIFANGMQKVMEETGQMLAAGAEAQATALETVQELSKAALDLYGTYNELGFRVIDIATDPDFLLAANPMLQVLNAFSTSLTRSNLSEQPAATPETGEAEAVVDFGERKAVHDHARKVARAEARSHTAQTAFDKVVTDSMALGNAYMQGCALIGTSWARIFLPSAFRPHSPVRDVVNH